MTIIDLSHINIVLFFVFLLFSVSVHEAMHGYMAYWLGDTTAKDMGRLTLNPLRHLDIYTSIIMPVILVFLHLPPFFIAKPVPFNPNRVKYDEFGAALVGLAGPLTNLSFAIIGAATLKIFAAQLSFATVNAFGLFIWLNVALFVFNMIPFPPLDGSRLVYAFAPEPLQKVMYSIESAGLMVIILFVLILVPVIGPVIIRINESILHLLGITVLGL